MWAFLVRYRPSGIKHGDNNSMIGMIYIVYGSDTSIRSGLDVSRFHITAKPDLFLGANSAAQRIMSPPASTSPAAPESSKKMHIDAEPPRPPPIASSTATASQPRTALAPPRDGQKKSVPANPALVGLTSQNSESAQIPPGFIAQTGENQIAR